MLYNITSVINVPDAFTINKLGKHSCACWVQSRASLQFSGPPDIDYVRAIDVAKQMPASVYYVRRHLGFIRTQPSGVWAIKRGFGDGTLCK